MFNLAILLSVLAGGLLGSLHCAAMCGPIGCLFKKQDQFIGYHLGRLISYALLTCVVFFSFNFILQTDSRPLKAGISIFFAFLLVIFGLVQVQDLSFSSRSGNLVKVQFTILNFFRTASQKFPFVMGFLTGLFPCAWLYSFVVLAAQSKSFFQALAVIFIFWLTSVPAFFLMTSGLKKLLQNSGFSQQRISGFVLIAAGIFSVVGHWADIISL